MRHTLAARALPALVPSTFRLPASADPDRVTHPALTAVPVAFLSAPPSDASAREPAGKPALRPRADAMRPVPGTFTFDIGRRRPAAPAHHLRWASDLVGDGRLDLPVSVGAGTRGVALFRSARAGPERAVGEAGRFTDFPIEGAGC